MSGRPCACGDDQDQHDDDGAGACRAALPPFAEQELPAWSCPCRGYTAAVRPAGPWTWHEATASWQGVAS